jgi:flagellar assembly protein FliH
MIEFTVPLTLPLRAVVRSSVESRAPDWLQAQHAQIPTSVAQRRAAAAESAAVQLQQQQLDQLQQEREAWTRGVVELQRAVGKANTQCASIVSEVREAAIELSLAIASKLVFQQLESGSFPIERLVSEVLGRLNTREPATIRLHPDDLAVLQKDNSFAPSLDPDGEVRLIADPKLGRGDCKAVAGEITIVYELRRQIEEIRRELLSTVNGHAESGH